MHTKRDDEERQIRESLLVAARQYVDQRARSRPERLALMWSFARALVMAGGQMFCYCLLPSRDGMGPIRECLERYAAHARDKWSVETDDKR